MAEPTDEILRARAHWSRPGGPRPNTIETPGPGQESVWSYPLDSAGIMTPLRV